MIAIGPVGETCPAHKSVPDIETNVRPILSDIAALGWLMVRDIQYLQKFVAAAAMANPAVPAARHSLPFPTILTRLTRRPSSISLPSRSFGLYRFLVYLGQNAWNPGSAKTYSGKFSVTPNRALPETGKRVNYDERASETSDFTQNIVFAPRQTSCNFVLRLLRNVTWQNLLCFLMKKKTVRNIFHPLANFFTWITCKEHHSN